MKETLTKLYTTKSLRISILIIGILFVLGIVFQVGVFVGYHKASFARTWGDHYGKNFGMEKPESWGGMMHGKFPNAHGAIGKVLTVTNSTIIVEDKDGAEKTILLTEKTIIKSGMQTTSATAITPDSFIVALGDPNKEGQIEAKLVRLMPAGINASTSMNTMIHGSPTGAKGMIWR